MCNNDQKTIYMFTDNIFDLCDKFHRPVFHKMPHLLLGVEDCMAVLQSVKYSERDGKLTHGHYMGI